MDEVPPPVVREDWSRERCCRVETSRRPSGADKTRTRAAPYSVRLGADVVMVQTTTHTVCRRRSRRSDCKNTVQDKVVRLAAVTQDVRSPGDLCTTYCNSVLHTREVTSETRVHRYTICPATYDEQFLQLYTLYITEYANRHHGYKNSENQHASGQVSDD